MRKNNGFTLTPKFGATLRSKGGFTLIELLVVVAIVGLLASIILVSFGGFQAKSRDTRRVSDMKSLRDSLALYQTYYASYPVQPTEEYITGADVMSQALISNRFIQGVILDPINGTNNSVVYKYIYQSTDNAKSYIIKYCLETNYIQGTNQGCNNQITP